MAVNSNSTGSAKAESLGLPQLDFSVLPSQLFWLVLTFGLLYFFIARVFIPKVAKQVDSREDGIKDNILSAEKANTSTEKLAKDLQKKINLAKSKASDIIEKQTKETKEFSDKAKQTLNAKIDAKLKDSEARIAKMRTASTSAIKEVTADVSSDIFNQIAKVTTKQTTKKLKKAS